VKAGRSLEVPLHLKDAHYAGAEKLGHGKGYQYSHDFPNHYVPQTFSPSTGVYYQPTSLGYEAKMKAWMETLRSPQSPGGVPH
jgi:putative ATPase